ncbi:homologous-pairing protein 2 homolog [Diorhabda sublineata]|uniref:homologous-pairing protein 2 homolog n=1 Tax=Diorhabda sublineata TaxID=1163346 RepID=UPI0024E13EC0|nr:homologous-pairing protein 2 homolog [Diorhabda sublineata]XP_056642552.1 homologous-pairing protein 2 homolog [Diorhabda sublineata]XP_056642553.1 homologous-pairing protein 2 homolog [Diorhabda sublineata]XP_056642554.1 homologous-pairing protein 2 homolog [Diorhabda sublineata]
MACNEAVLKFLEYHNRPYSANDIQSGVKGDFGKSAVMKALVFLVQKGKILEKTYGKQKIYCIIQNAIESSSDLQERLLELDRDINEKTLQLKELRDECKRKTKLVSDIKGKVSLTSALYRKVNLEKEIENIENMLKGYSDCELICSQKKQEVSKEFEKYLKEMKKRRRIGLDILNTILDSYPKTRKQLCEDIGIETDEGAGFSVDKFQ